MSFFNVTNPFTSPVGQRIEQATDASLPSENWALNMEICDIINETEDGPRDAIKAIKKRLNQAAGKNYTIVMYTLTVLETCVKNCGKRFHALACTREFVQELVKLLGPKNDPPTAVQEKVLNLIQTWADTFRNQPHTQGVVQTYQELKSKGIEFPMTDLDAMAPIITPERSVPETDISMAGAAAAAADLHASKQPRDLALLQQQQIEVAAQMCRSPAMSGQPVKLDHQQLEKLRDELGLVHGNIRVFSEMLADVSGGVQESGSIRPVDEDMELLTEMYDTCKEMQERLVDLIGKLAHDEVTAEMLQMNDEMNNLFLRYTRFTKNNQVPASALVAQAIGATGGAAAASSAAAKKKLEAGDSLIDLSDDESETAGAMALPINSLEKRMIDIGLAGESIGEASSRRKEGEKDEFDAFAQSRTVSFDAAKNRHELRGLDEEANSSASRTKNMAQTDKSVTSSEFERFLAERTAAVAGEITGSSSQGAGAAAASSGPTIQRQIDKDQEDKSLFAL